MPKMCRYGHVVGFCSCRIILVEDATFGAPSEAAYMQGRSGRSCRTVVRDVTASEFAFHTLKHIRVHGWRFETRSGLPRDHGDPDSSILATTLRGVIAGNRSRTSIRRYLDLPCGKVMFVDQITHDGRSPRGGKLPI